MIKFEIPSFRGIMSNGVFWTIMDMIADTVLTVAALAWLVYILSR